MGSQVDTDHGLPCEEFEHRVGGLIQGHCSSSAVEGVWNTTQCCLKMVVL